tara:strand:+ start:54636 stop:55691 length:1056 start_codon:yes stop_codon:yes gene_type:complete
MESKTKKILVTGVAGFIGFSLVKRLLKEEKFKIIGLDNINSYYSPILKQKRINILDKLNINKKWHFFKIDLEDKFKVIQIFEKYKPDIVINLAAQAGVRYSLKNPTSYINSNIVGFLNILEGCRNQNVEHLIYASSSSVYGGSIITPFNESNSVDHPISLYAATKKSNEVLAHSYSHLFQIPMTGLRFFTVYGPMGRPDMAPMIFADAMLKGQPINVFNNGEMSRDFTYIDDVVDAIYKCCFKIPYSNVHFYEKKPDPSTSFAPHRILNVGNNNPTNLLDFIEILESALGVKAIKEMKPMQPGDVKATCADINRLKEWVNFNPRTSLTEGIYKFASWYKEYFKSDYYRIKN